MVRNIEDPWPQVSSFFDNRTGSIKNRAKTRQDHRAPSRRHDSVCALEGPDIDLLTRRLPGSPGTLRWAAAVATGHLRLRCAPDRND